jgi:hypothetical protein
MSKRDIYLVKETYALAKETWQKRPGNVSGKAKETWQCSKRDLAKETWQCFWCFRHSSRNISICFWLYHVACVVSSALSLCVMCCILCHSVYFCFLGQSSPHRAMQRLSPVRARDHPVVEIVPNKARSLSLSLSLFLSLSLSLSLSLGFADILLPVQAYSGPSARQI